MESYQIPPCDSVNRGLTLVRLEHELHYINKYENNPTSLQMAWISLIDEKLDKQHNGRNIILFDVYFEKLFNFNIFFMI